jgi:hypothetical protein
MHHLHESGDADVKTGTPLPYGAVDWLSLKTGGVIAARAGLRSPS